MLGRIVQSAVLVAGLAVMLGAVLAGPVQRVGNPAVTDLAALLKQLGDPDFAVREGAQKQLDALPTALRERLMEMEAKETDPEVKARLAKRIEQMEVEQVINPPRITLKMENQPLNKIVDALNAQMGGVYLATPFRDVYNVNVEEQPFWEVIRQLNKQKPLGVGQLTPAAEAGFGNAGTAVFVILPPSAQTAIPADFRVINGMAVLPTAMMRRAEMGVVADGALAGVVQQRELLIVGVRVMADPRVRFSHYQTSVVFTDLMDDEGRNLLPRAPAAPGLGTLPRPAPSFNSTPAIDVTGLTIKKLAVMKGTVRAIVPVRTEKVVIENATVPVANAVKTALGEYTIEKMEAMPGADRYLIKFEKVKVAPTVSGVEPRVMLRAGNKAGETVSSSSLLVRETFSYTLNVPPAARAGARDTRPARLELLYPVRSAELTIEVDFKNLTVGL